MCLLPTKKCPPSINFVHLIGSRHLNRTNIIVIRPFLPIKSTLMKKIEPAARIIVAGIMNDAHDKPEARAEAA